MKRIVLVTGGAKRVGRAIVERLAAKNWQVIFTYLRSEDEAKSLAKKSNAIAIRADLTEPNAAIEIISERIGSIGRLDAIVNNASMFHANSLSQVDLESSRKMMAIHFESPMLLAKHFEHMLRASAGSIVNMIDLLAERPWPEYLAYSASKAALANLTLSLARELAPQVRVNGIAPGVVDWPAEFPHEDREIYLKRVPLGRPGNPSDVADLVQFLLDSGSYITSQIIRLDGGRSIT